MTPLLEQKFDQNATTYDHLWDELFLVRDGLNLLVAAAFFGLPEHSRILCVGAGTGSEIIFLAERFPNWHFTAVEPSKNMLDVCRSRLEERGLLLRCSLHQGYLATLPDSPTFDAATSLLVSHFVMVEAARVDFFRGIAKRLKSHGLLVSADLSADLNSAIYQELLFTWRNLMGLGGVPANRAAQVGSSFGRDVAVLEPMRVAGIIEAAGFDPPMLIYQAGLIHAWSARRRDLIDAAVAI